MKYLLTLLAMVLFLQCRTSRPSEGARIGDIPYVVVASVETDKIPRGKEKDSADDPAIWLNKDDPATSIIFGSDKRGGVAAYNLSGEQLAYYKLGKMNNIDIRYNIFFNGRTIDVLAGSNRTKNTIDVFEIDKNGELSLLPGGSVLTQLQGEVYGFCLGNIDGVLFAYVNSKMGEVEQYKINTFDPTVSFGLVRKFSVNTQTEGMVVDDVNATLFLGKEETGIYTFGAAPIPADTIGERILQSSATDNSNVVYDIEGLAVYKTSDTTGYLLASVQGNYSYAIYTFEAPNTYLFSFRIGRNQEIDAVEETDGIEVCSNALPRFSKGILVVQDGFNYNEKGDKIAQNFKVVNWQQIQNLIDAYPID